MKASELRIGNWIEYAGKSVRCNVEHIIKEVDLNNAMGQPIPLTPKWLEKFGFIKPFDQVYYLHPNNSTTRRFRVFKMDDLFDFVVSGSFNETFLTKIKHVHQLQNLYFALTGEELHDTTKKGKRL